MQTDLDRQALADASAAATNGASIKKGQAAAEPAAAKGKAASRPATAARPGTGAAGGAAKKGKTKKKAADPVVSITGCEATCCSFVLADCSTRCECYFRGTELSALVPTGRDGCGGFASGAGSCRHLKTLRCRGACTVHSWRQPGAAGSAAAAAVAGGALRAACDLRSPADLCGAAGQV